MQFSLPQLSVTLPSVPYFLNVIAAILATYRLTELVTVDRITQGLRNRTASYLLSCQRCVSVWAGCATALAYFTLPALNWPLALAWVYLWQQDLRRPYVKVKAVPAGTVQLTTSLANRDDVRNLLMAALQLTSAPPPIPPPLVTPPEPEATK